MIKRVSDYVLKQEQRDKQICARYLLDMILKYGPELQNQASREFDNHKPPKNK